jgi:hypothetical protein
MNHVALNHEIFVNEFRTVGVVGVDAAHLGRRKEHNIERLATEEIFHGLLVDQVQLAMCAGDDAVVPPAGEQPHEGRADHPPVAGDIDARVFGKSRVGHSRLP